MENPILTRDELRLQSEKWRRERRVTVLTNGCFDLLHAGHLRSFVEAKSFGQILIVGINSDRSVRDLKGATRPLVGESDRALLVSALRPVDYVTLFDEPDARELLRIIRPAIYVKGGDYTLDSLPERDLLIELGVAARFVPLVAGLSTTELVNKIRRANL